MAKFTIVIAESDAWYNDALKQRLERVYQNKVNIIQYSDETMFMQMFQRPIQIDLLIVGEELYAPDLERYPITFTMVLCEQAQALEADANVRIKRICRYTPAKALLMQLAGWIRTDEKRADCRLIMVYGPEGGSGKTTTAMGICNSLVRLNQRVLYMNTGVLQDFGHLFQGCSPISGDFERMMRMGELQAEYLMGLCGEDGFSYMKPFSLAAYNFEYTDQKFLRLAQRFSKTGRYDYIVIDTSSGLSPEKTAMMSACDSVLIVLGQTEESRYKLEVLQKNIDITDRDKFTVICNRYRQEERNHLPDMLAGVFIPMLPLNRGCSARKLEPFDCYNQIAYGILRGWGGMVK